jgi:hypothetical protein
MRIGRQVCIYRGHLHFANELFSSNQCSFENLPISVLEHKQKVLADRLSAYFPASQVLVHDLDLETLLFDEDNFDSLEETLEWEIDHGTTNS